MIKSLGVQEGWMTEELGDQGVAFPTGLGGQEID